MPKRIINVEVNTVALTKLGVKKLPTHIVIGLLLLLSSRRYILVNISASKIGIIKLSANMTENTFL